MLYTGNASLQEGIQDCELKYLTYSLCRYYCKNFYKIASTRHTIACLPNQGIDRRLYYKHCDCGRFSSDSTAKIDHVSSNTKARGADDARQARSSMVVSQSGSRRRRGGGALRGACAGVSSDTIRFFVYSRRVTGSHLF